MVATLRSRILHVIAAFVALFALGATAASAETLMMPARDAQTGTQVVVWGITQQANGTPYTITFGDGSQATGNIGDRSYIAVNHTYSTTCLPGAAAPCPGTHPVSAKFTATLTIGAESASVQVQVFDTPQLSLENKRSLGINMAIQDGLRWLWVNQVSRTNFDSIATTYWTGNECCGQDFTAAYTSFVTLAFENHGYKIQKADGTANTGIYEKYLVRRGLNYVLAHLAPISINSTSKQRPDPTTYALTNYTDDPCVGLAAFSDPCNGLAYTPPATYSFGADNSYHTAVAMLALAGSGAMTKVNTEVGGYINGKTYKEILQRMSNAQVFGQNDSGNGRGGWYYSFNQGPGDGSTLGWAVLGLLDAEAAGVVVPQFVKEELKYQVGWQKPDKSVVLAPLAVTTTAAWITAPTATRPAIRTQASRRAAFRSRRTT